MGRLQVLSKAAMTSRKTYEKTLKKYQSLESQLIKIENRVDKWSELYKQIRQESLEKAPVEQHDELKHILSVCGDLHKYDIDFIPRSTAKIKELNIQYEINNNRIDEIIELTRPLLEQLDKIEMNFRDKWNNNRSSVTELETIKVSKEHKRVNDERIRLSTEAFNYLGVRDKCKTKAKKLHKKCNRYIELLETKETMIAEFCNKYGIENSPEKIVDLMNSFNSHYEEEKDCLDRVKMYEDMMDEHLSEMSLVKSKLDVSKDKMEEAEYLYREYRNMTSIGA